MVFCNQIKSYCCSYAILFHMSWLKLATLECTKDCSILVFQFLLVEGECSCSSMDSGLFENMVIDHSTQLGADMLGSRSLSQVLAL